MVQFCTGRHTKVPKAMHESTKWCLLVACGLICASLWSRSQCSRLAFEVEEGEIHGKHSEPFSDLSNFELHSNLF